jgi:hypothetical protein
MFAAGDSCSATQTDGAHTTSSSESHRIVSHQCSVSAAGLQTVLNSRGSAMFIQQQLCCPTHMYRMATMARNSRRRIQRNAKDVHAIKCFVVSCPRCVQVCTLWLMGVRIVMGEVACNQMVHQQVSPRLNRWQ